MTAALEGGEWSAARPGRTLPPGKTRYPLYRRLGGPQGRSGRAENLVHVRILDVHNRKKGLCDDHNSNTLITQLHFIALFTVHVLYRHFIRTIERKCPSACLVDIRAAFQAAAKTPDLLYYATIGRADTMLREASGPLQAKRFLEVQSTVAPY